PHSQNCGCNLHYLVSWRRPFAKCFARTRHRSRITEPSPLNHVLESELAELWAELTIGDVLVFYQHQTNRNGQSWIATKKDQLATALTSILSRQPASSPCASSVRGSPLANFLQTLTTVLGWTSYLSATCRTVRPAERSAKIDCCV